MAKLNEALCALNRKFGNRGVIFCRAVEGRSDNFTLDCALHVGYFLRTLIN